MRAARTALSSAERGEDVAAEQIRALRAEDIDAVPLVDVVTLTDAQRPVWEARLLPYRHAVVVPHGATTTAGILSAMPGSLLVYADPSDGPNGRPRTRPADLPLSADARFMLSTFLAALTDRAGRGPGHIDATADVHAMSGFKEPLTGRAGRIEEARAVLDAAVADDEEADKAVAAAQRELKRAREREEAARAGVEAAEIAARVATLRQQNEANTKEQGKLASPMEKATVVYYQALADKAARETRISAIRNSRF